MRLPLEIEKRRMEISHMSARLGRGMNPAVINMITGQDTANRPYQCRQCGKGFMQKNTLRNHQLTHTGEKPYECNVCGKRFGRSHVLKDHMRTHTGERPYKCEKCGWAFSHKCNLKSHILTCKVRTPQQAQNKVQSGEMP